MKKSIATWSFAFAGLAPAVHAQYAAPGANGFPLPPKEPWYQQAWHTVRDPAPEKWYQGVWKNWSDLWRLGDTTVVIPFSTYHFRFAYTREQIDEYTEWPFGFGFGRARPDERGNMRDVYIMGFQDSHGKPSYMAGYRYMWQWRPIEGASDFRIGAGYTIFLMARSDTFGGYVPFPGILPVATIAYKRFALESAYVPGGQGVGNVLFTYARIQF
jgi:hypothetical protein